MRIIHGDCLEVLKGFEAASIDACVTDPPYGLAFMGKHWDHGIPGAPFWFEVKRVLKPGAHLLAFGGTRTYHRLACAIEDTGFEIRDQMQWLYGQGFPKSASALKPAHEPIVLARKPGRAMPLNIEACRVGFRERPKITDPKKTVNTYNKIDIPGGKLLPNARWPANVITDGSQEVLDLFPYARSGEHPANRAGIGYNSSAQGTRGERIVLDQGGSAARFFYSAKASKADRAGSKHPTIKPISLLQYLCRLVTPPGGTVLDPFAGSGTTGEAAIREGFRPILIEKEAEYVADIERRAARLSLGPQGGSGDMASAGLDRASAHS